MSDAPEGPERPRRTFIQPAPPTPFLKSREGRRILLFVGLFALAGIVLYGQYQKAAAVVERAQAERARTEAEPVLPLEVRLEQKRAALATAFDGALQDSENGDGFVETAGYRKLIEFLAGYSPEEVTAKSTAYLDHATTMAEPDLVRGEFVHVRGLVGGMWAHKLERPVQHVTDVWRGTVAQPDAESDTIVFDLVGDPPPELELQFTVVEVDGVLYRTVGYESRTGQQRDAPYLLARNLRVIEGASPSGAGEKTLITAVGAFAIILYLLLRYSWHARKRPVEWSARSSRRRSSETPRIE